MAALAHAEIEKLIIHINLIFTCSAEIPNISFPDQGFGHGKILSVGLCKGCWFLLSGILDGNCDWVLN